MMDIDWVLRAMDGLAAAFEENPEGKPLPYNSSFEIENPIVSF
jgi:hypothetical protein